MPPNSPFAKIAAEMAKIHAKILDRAGLTASLVSDVIFQIAIA
ncbi:MAG: hypothetical protein NW214_06150 [Pseudanabaenaceae cyanobacterium bins.39]|nr:hypothetical protein [Pseudanabaenaceae cyanobacterium bins.39]